MRYYPTFLDMRGKRCLIVGIGDVGRRKLTSLLAANPEEVLVLDTFLFVEIADPELKELLSHPAVTYQHRPFVSSDVQGRALVFACTGSRTVNETVARACDKRTVLCNVIDAPDEGDFIVPAHFDAGELIVAISTGGNSPALARRIRMELQEFVGNRFSRLVTLMGRLRPLVLARGAETGHNTKLFRNIVGSDLMDALQDRDRGRSETILTELLPQELHPHIGELLHELV
ncbi:bifunctional precorrin-2 dehydrogenase/sirohydrochlorin ferrochelatase [Desulfovibrio mangrovi]|uniref:precorrin-2 dehydrogenase/sirohydrochlorin ferrochelatase family protein n=1 Tax=Desulfovibrio mangrovi TaxID=2976983 RepID=UPI002248039B|nr:bifunctional precorrin-2 dehydrogenase/sirohydrochlorin ferrochelatase [Desulfovibrio mangrovi]UZP68349.1 bifunctional precorrin-2 dehydrogenase/sirohydrochlorin ferrochelatase [Desulfovibrio mangrovi]